MAKYFGPLPAGPKVEKLDLPAPSPGQSQRIKMTDRVGLARIFLNWHSVPQFTPDDAELEVLADILGNGKTSRLYRALVRDKQIAQDVHASENSQELSGGFSISASARSGHTLAELETVILAEIARIQAEPPTADEIARAVNRTEADLVHALESISEFGGRADRLNMYNVYTGDPGYLSKDFERYLQVDPAGVQRVAKKYLSGVCVTLEVTPGKEVAITPDPRVTAADRRGKNWPRAKSRWWSSPRRRRRKTPTAPRSPKAAAEPTFKPAADPSRQALQWHVRWWSSRTIELPSISIHALFPEGEAAIPRRSRAWPGSWPRCGTKGPSVAPRSRSAMNWPASAPASRSCPIGTRPRPGSSRLERNLPTALDIYSDVLQHPVFPEEEFTRQRNIALGRLLQVRDEPTALATIAVCGTLFGQDHPYGRPQFGTPDGAEIRHPRPARGLLPPLDASRRGDADRRRRHDARGDRRRVGKGPGGWKASGPSPAPAIPRPAARQAAPLLLIDKPARPSRSSPPPWSARSGPRPTTSRSW